MYRSSCIHCKFECGSYTTYNTIFYYGIKTFSVFIAVFTVFIINSLLHLPLLNLIHSYMEVVSHGYSIRTKYLLSASNEELNISFTVWPYFHGTSFGICNSHQKIITEQHCTAQFGMQNCDFGILAFLFLLSQSHLDTLHDSNFELPCPFIDLLTLGNRLTSDTKARLQVFCVTRWGGFGPALLREMAFKKYPTNFAFSPSLRTSRMQFPGLFGRWNSLYISLRRPG